MLTNYTDIPEYSERTNSCLGCLISTFTLIAAVVATIPIKGFWLCTGMFFTVLIGGFAGGNIGSSIGNYISDFTRPKIIGTQGGLGVIAGIKIFWLIIPQLIGIILGWTLGVHLLLALFWKMPLHSLGSEIYITDTPPISVSKKFAQIKEDAGFVKMMSQADQKTKVDALLMVAIETDNVWLVRELLATNVDIQKKRLKLNKDGIPFREKTEASPLFAALSHTFDRSEIAMLLIQHGANVNEYDNQFKGPTPLLFVLRNNMPSLVIPLLQKGARVDVIDIDRKTPLHHAANLNFSEAACLMVKAGAQLNVKDKYGNTPLDYASPAMREKLVRWQKNFN